MRRGMRSTPRPNAVRMTNREGRSPFVLICDHASNFIPRNMERSASIPADSPASHRLGSRRAAGRAAHGRGARRGAGRILRLAAGDRLQPAARRARPHSARSARRPRFRAIASLPSRGAQPAHRAVVAAVPRRRSKRHRGAAGAPAGATWLVSVHSFTPVYRGVPRPWQIGIIHDDDTRLAAPLIAALQSADRHRPSASTSPIRRPTASISRWSGTRARAACLRDDRNPQRRNRGRDRAAEMGGPAPGIFSDLEPEVRAEDADRARSSIC